MITTALVLLSLLPQSLGVTAQVGCTDAERVLGLCPTVSGSLGNGQATLEGSGNANTPGSGGNSGATAPVDTPNDPNANCAYVLNGSCYLGPRTHPEPATAVTLADIASFRPDPSVDNMEPNGWTIAGLDTNFYATGGAHIKDGTLLGQPASVRFTPVTWYWSYGDGTSASRAFPGGTWAAQGIREFDPTGTSHVYREYGTYYIDLDVDYAAEYRFAGGSWTPIAGVLTLPANRLVITAGNAKTVLVERECTRNPVGPGC